MPATTAYERFLYTCDVRTLEALTPDGGNPVTDYKPEWECDYQKAGVVRVFVGEWLANNAGALNRPALARGLWHNDALNRITNLQRPGTPATGFVWHELPARPRSLTFTETPERADLGLRYLHTITAAWSERKESALILADKLRGRKLRAVVEMADGRRLLVPTIMLSESPFSAQSGELGYALTFAGYALTPAYALECTAWEQQTVISN